MKQTRQDKISKNRPVSLRDESDPLEAQNQSYSAIQEIFNIDSVRNNQTAVKSLKQARKRGLSPEILQHHTPFKQTFTPFVQRIINR